MNRRVLVRTESSRIEKVGKRKKVSPNLVVMTVEFKCEDPEDLAEYVSEAREYATQYGEVVRTEYFEEKS